jgi:hypothetical protein
VTDNLANTETPQIKPVVASRFPTKGPQHRFGAILFVEKEGFLPLFKQVRLAERYDIAIMSTKGLSVTASRLLVDRVCAKHDIPLLVLHDFDKSGFSIVGTLQRDTRRYAFANDIRVIDLGLRLKDVEEWHLESETVSYVKSDPKPNLRRNGATEEEVAVLCDRRGWSDDDCIYFGRRVELNAFTSGDLVTWIESSLVRHGIKKVVPDLKTLAAAYRRALAAALVRQRLDDAIREAQEQARQAKVPKTIARQVKARLEESPDLSWDLVVAALADQLGGFAS